MDLPLVEEIREARRLSDESRDATLHLQRVNVALASVDIIQSQLGGGLTHHELPGEEILDLLVERWPQLSDLRAADLSPRAPYPERLTARRRQLQQAWTEIKPLMDQSEVRAHHLGHLQEEQRELLEDPKWAAATAELHALGVEREQYARAIGPLRQRLSLVSPAWTVVHAFEQRIEAEYRQLEMISDPTGLTTWRALAVTEGMLGSVAEAIHSLGLEIPVPEAPSVPASYDEVDRDSVRERIGRALQELGGLLDSLHRQRVILESEEQQVSKQLDALTQAIVDRMG